MLQRVLWATDYKAHEWQQRVAQQQRFRSGQSRFNLTRHISMPANNKTCSGSDESGSYEQSSAYHMQHVLSNDSASPSIAADPGNTLYVGQGTAESAQQHLSASCVRVPSSNCEASASCLLPEVPSLSGLVSKSLLKANSSSTSSCSSPCQPSHVRSSSTGTNRTAKRRVSDVGGRVMKAYQPMMSLAAKARASAQDASALSKSAGNAEQQQAVAVARVKAGNMERSAGLSPIHSRSAAASSAGQPTVPGSSTFKESGKLALVK